MIGRLFYLMIIGFLLFTVDGMGQNTWVKNFGGSDPDEGHSVTSTTDGGYVLTGKTYSNDGNFGGMNNGNSDIFVIKLKSYGDIDWKRIYGGYNLDGGSGGSNLDGGNSIISTIDGGYIVTGSTKSSDGDFSGMNKGNSDIFVIKLNSNGDLVWKKTIGGSGPDEGSSVTSTSDGGCVLTGRTYSNDGDFSGMINSSGFSDIFIVKLNSNGYIDWKKCFGGSESERGNSITYTNDGGYVLTGYTKSRDGDFVRKYSSNTDIFVVKINSMGDMLWKKTFWGTYSDEGHSITYTNDGGYILTGYTNSDDGDFSGMNRVKLNKDIFVIKLNLSGDIVWKKTFGGGNDDFGLSIRTTFDGGYILTGFTNSNDGDFNGMNKGFIDIFIIKLNLYGNIVWKRTFGGSEGDYGYSITPNIDKEYVVTGWTRSNEGVFSGMNKGSTDIFVMKLDSNGNLNNTTSINEFSEPTTTLSVHPNPFSNSTTISYKVNTPSNVRIELLNTLGQTIEVLREDYTDIGTYQLPLNVSTLSSGLYSVRMKSGSMNEVVPVWVVR